MTGSTHAAPIPKPAPPQKRPDAASQAPTLGSPDNQRAQDRPAPDAAAVRRLVGAADAGQPVQPKPIDAGYGDIVAAASASRIPPASNPAAVAGTSTGGRAPAKPGVSSP